MSEFSKAVAHVDFDAQTKKLLALVSPSQVETWDQCNRKWVFAYIFGLKTPPAPGQADGTELHTECEHTSNSGGEVRDTKWKAIVQKALAEGLILIGDNIKNEQWVEIPTYPDGPTMRGKYDAVDFNLRPRVDGTVARLVNDYKSTKDFRWIKTPAELRGNTQLTTYGLAVLRAHPEDTHVALRHTYLRTTGAAAVTKVEATMPREHVIKRWQGTTLRHIKAMQQLVHDLPRTEGAITSVEPTLTHCSAFRGCPYRSMCGLGTETFSFADLPSTPRVDENFSFTSVEANEEETNMGLLEDMMNGVKPKTLEAPPAQTTKEVAPASGVCAKCKGKRYIPNPAPDAPTGSHIMCKECGKTSITPPDQPPRDAGRLPPAEASAEAEAPKKRGRPKKESTPEPSMKIFVEEEDGTRREVVTEDAKEEAATAREGALDDVERAKAYIDNKTSEILESAKKAKPSKEGVAIYVDCLPTKGAHSGEGIDYLEWLAPVAERVAASKKKADWRMIEYSAEGELAAEIHATIKKSGLPPVVLVSGSSRARAPFLEVAGMFASTVVMAVGR